MHASLFKSIYGQMASNFLVVKMFSNLFFPRERKSPPLPLQFAFGWAMSNFGQDTTREGQELLFCEQNIRNEWYSELKKRYLEVNYTFGVAPIRLPMLGLVAKTLVWPDVNNLKIDALESRYIYVIYLHRQHFNEQYLTWAPGDFPGGQMISGQGTLVKNTVVVGGGEFS